jgi:hypothetical protein
VAWLAWGVATATATAPPELAVVVVGAVLPADVVGAAVVALDAAVVADFVVGAAVLAADVAVTGFVVSTAAAATHTNRLFTFVHRSVAPPAAAVWPAAGHVPPAFADLVFAAFGFGAAFATLVACHPTATITVVASKVRVTIRFVMEPIVVEGHAP